jgi:predicted aspartyl protease
MGGFPVELEVANHRDLVMAENGVLDPAKVRRLTITGVVDTGATRLVLPQSVVKQWGLAATGKVKVRYADGRTATRQSVKDVDVQILGRSGNFTAVVEPNRRRALMGAIVLEDLDYLVDCSKQRLFPRDPRFVISEIE